MTTTPAQKAVIFDLDGVIVDTAEFHRQSWYQLAVHHGFAISDDFFYKTFGMQNYQIIPLLAARSLSPEEIETLADEKETSFRNLAAGKLKTLDGVKQLVDDLKQNRFLLAIGSSAPRENLQFMLRHVGLENCFDALVVGEDVTRGKPAPDTFLRAAEKLSLPPASCVVIEDAVAGVHAAKAARMSVIAVTNTRKKEELAEADLVVHSLAELSADDFEKLIQKNI